MSFLTDQIKIAEDIQIGNKVIARFTNCNMSHQFPGEIVGITKNYYKVKCLANFRRSLSSDPQWADENGLSKDKDRILQVETINSRKHSVNNCIASIE